MLLFRCVMMLLLASGFFWSGSVGFAQDSKAEKREADGNGASGPEWGQVADDVQTAINFTRDPETGKIKLGSSGFSVGGEGGEGG